MIPLQDQEILREYFQTELTGPVKIEFFAQRPLALFIAGREDCRFCKEVQQLLTEIRGLSPRVSLRTHELGEAQELTKQYGVSRAPSTVLRGQLNRPILLEGFFSGTLFSAFIDLVRTVSRGSTELSARMKRRLQRIRDDVTVRLFVSPGCPYSPGMLRTLTAFSLENPRIKAIVTEVEEFPQLMAVEQIAAVPYTSIGGRLSFGGALDEEGFLDQIMKVVEGHILSLGQVSLGAANRPVTPLQQQPEGQPELQTTRSGLIIPGR